MLEYDFKKSIIANIKRSIGWINFLLADNPNAKQYLQSQIDEQTEILGDQEYRICLLELGVTEDDL